MLNYFQCTSIEDMSTSIGGEKILDFRANRTKGARSMILIRKMPYKN